MLLSEQELYEEMMSFFFNFSYIDQLVETILFGWQKRQKTDQNDWQREISYDGDWYDGILLLFLWKNSISWIFEIDHFFCRLCNTLTVPKIELLWDVYSIFSFLFWKWSVEMCWMKLWLYGYDWTLKILLLRTKNLLSWLVMS